MTLKTNSLLAVIAGIIFAGSALATEPVLDESEVSLASLIEYTIENDAELIALRGRLGFAEAMRRNAAPINNPQLRLGYSESSDTADLESLLDPTVLPSQDLNDRAEQYSAQVRFYPRNPFVIHAQKKRAAREKHIVDTELSAATHTRILDVTESYLNMLSMHLELQQREQEQVLRLEEEAVQEALFEAGRLSADIYNEGRIRGLEAQMDLSDAEQDYVFARQNLLMAAGLESDMPVLHEIPQHLENVVADRINTESLRETMKRNNPVLYNMDAQHDLARSEVKMVSAGQIPWINLLSATYQREERFDIKYRDEFSIVAGIEIPIFDWFSGRKKAPYKLQMNSLENQYAQVESGLDMQLDQAITRLKNSEARLALFVERKKEISAEISSRLSEIEETGDLLQKQQVINYKRMLLDLESKSFQMKHDHAMRIIALERLLGVRLIDVM